MSAGDRPSASKRCMSSRLLPVWMQLLSHQLAARFLCQSTFWCFLTFSLGWKIVPKWKLCRCQGCKWAAYCTYFLKAVWMYFLDVIARKNLGSRIVSYCPIIDYNETYSITLQYKAPWGNCCCDLVLYICKTELNCTWSGCVAVSTELFSSQLSPVSLIRKKANLHIQLLPCSNVVCIFCGERRALDPGNISFLAVTPWPVQTGEMASVSCLLGSFWRI